MAYSTGNVADLIGVSRETVRQWTIEYGKHMSDAATPKEGAYRRYNDDDVRIFAYIVKSRSLGLDTDEVHKALSQGARADLDPDTSSITSKATNNQITALKTQIDILRKQLSETQQQQSEQVGRIKQLESDLKSAQTRIEELVEKATRAELMLEMERDRMKNYR